MSHVAFTKLTECLISARSATIPDPRNGDCQNEFNDDVDQLLFKAR
jgi:hypothetical protein